FGDRFHQPERSEDAAPSLGDRKKERPLQIQPTRPRDPFIAAERKGPLLARAAHADPHDARLAAGDCGGVDLVDALAQSIRLCGARQHPPRDHHRPGFLPAEPLLAWLVALALRALFALFADLHDLEGRPAVSQAAHGLDSNRARGATS